MYINLNLYRIFLVVAKSKSYSDASKKLNISTTAISKNINQLEDLLDTKLFFRENDGVKLTADGSKLFEYVEKSMNEIDAGEKLILQKNDLDNGEIAIGSLSHISSFYIMDAIDKAVKEHPNLKITLVNCSSGKELIKLLEEHKIDFAIDNTAMTIDKTRICKEELKNMENIFISDKPVNIKDIKELEKLPIILGLEYTYTSRELLNLLKEYNVELNPKIKIDYTELKINEVKRGLGISYVLKEAVKKELKNKEIFEVTVPIELPTSKLNLLYLNGQLTKADKTFIRKYLK